MNAGLRAMLTGLIDYAGLFPPAKLSMDVAVRNYLRYREEAESWMLGRFICPASRLGELAAFHAEIAAGRPLVVSALASGGETAQLTLDRLRVDVEEIQRCELRHEGRVVIDTLELRAPPDLVGTLHRLRVWFTAAAEVVSKRNLFVEVPMAADVVSRTAEALRNVRTSQLGMKFRCGGMEAAAFPTSAQLAAALGGCLAHQLPFKATAGLHHPLPRFDAGVQARMHGFVNLFSAGVLVCHHRVEAEEAIALLDEADPDAIRFDDTGLRWRDWSVTVEQIASGREQFAHSFGSCSFDEPRDDLRALGWL